MKRISIRKTSLVFAFVSIVANAGYHDVSAYTQQTYQGSVSYVPAGTPVTVSLSQALGSQFSKPGETFTATLSSPIYAGGGILAPAGSQVQGTVVTVTPAGRAGQPGSMDLRLVNIITPNGRMIPLSASIDQANFQLKADGGRASHLVKTTAVGAGAGALSGLIGGAISGGRKGQATAIGTGIGAGVGLLGGAIKKGDELIVESGTSIPFKLDQPIQAANTAPQVQQYSPEYAGSYQAAPSAGGFADPTQMYQTQPITNPYLNP
jgi:hypothetical protein